MKWFAFSSKLYMKNPSGSPSASLRKVKELEEGTESFPFRP